jgi:DNA polymerase III gamma/tau subunit
MKQLRHIVLAVLLATVLVSVPVFAEGSSGSGSTDDPSNTQPEQQTEPEHTETPQQKPAETPHKKSTEQKKTDDSTATETEQHSKTRKKGEEKVAELRKTKKTHSAEERQQQCEARKDKIASHVSEIGTKTTTIQKHIDEVYAKALAYQQSKNIQSDELTALIAAADAAKATATASSADVAASQPSTIDCTDANLPTELATFGAAVSQNRTDLKAYRDAVKSVLKALKAATPTTDKTDTTTGGTQ